MASEDNVMQARNLLKQIGISMKADLVTANIPTRSARDLGIPDEPDVQIVRQARGLAERPMDALLNAADNVKIERKARKARTLEVAQPAG